VENLAHYFSGRTLLLKGIMPVNEGFQGGNVTNLFQIILFSSAEEKNLSLKRKPSKLEAGASSTLFPCKN
jgi:hypothetical protein